MSTSLETIVTTMHANDTQARVLEKKIADTCIFGHAYNYVWDALFTK